MRARRFRARAAADSVAFIVADARGLVENVVTSACSDSVVTTTVNAVDATALTLPA